MNNMRYTFLILTLFMMISCGDIFSKKESDEGVNLSQFGTCELDIDAFSYILEQNIKGDVLCLQEKLHLFMDAVETDRPGYISKVVLQNFLITGPIDVEPDVVDIVESVFDLSYIIIGTDKNYIKRDDVDVLFDFLVYFNEHIWKSYKYFTSDKEVSYFTHLKERAIIYDEFTLIADKLKSIYKGNRDHVAKVDTDKFLVNFFQNDPETLDQVRKVMFLKKVFLGGSNEELTNIEFKEALDAIASLAQVTFDVVKSEKFDFEDKQRKMMELFSRDVETVKNALFFKESDNENLFSINDIIQAIYAFIDPEDIPLDLIKYKKEIKTVKDILLGSEDDLFNSGEVHELIGHGMHIFNEAEFFYKVYNYPLYTDALNSRKPISHDFSDFPVVNSTQQDYLSHFASITQNYKFFKGNNSSPTFDFDFHRNKNGVVEIAAFEYLITLVMEKYGQRNVNARGGVDMTLEQTVTLLDDFKILLRDEGIITVGRVGGGEVANTADNLVLMSTLFQYQSDGCDSEISCMEVPELTEFVIGLFTALEVKDFFTDNMLVRCSSELDEFDRISPQCFRENFIKVLETNMPEDGKSIADYMPLLYNYLLDMVKDLPEGTPVTESTDYMKFITETEAFTRTCTHYDKLKTEEIPLKGTDAFGVFAGLLNIESTMLKFDLNSNGVLDGRARNGDVNEVMKAYYDVYRGAMTALVAPDGGFMTKLVKPIFKYLIREGTVPDQTQFRSLWRFVKFLLKKNKAADAQRVTIATVLKTLGEQSENSINYPFKCDECLRDPNKLCIPEDGSWE